MHEFVAAVIQVSSSKTMQTERATTDIWSQMNYKCN